MTWGTVTVGRLVLRETFTVQAARNASSGARTLVLTGEESSPPLTVAQVRQRAEDILGLLERLVPITFTDKTDHDGLYVITDVSVSPTDYQGEVVKAAWSISAEYLGPANDVDVESRLTGAVRANDFALSGERWHAPAGGHFGYHTGSTPPSGSVDRAGADGTVTVYRGFPASVAPRWGTTLAGYGTGRVRVLVDGTERVAAGLKLSGTGWELNNSLVGISPGASGTFQLRTYTPAGWQSETWNVSIGASASGEVTSWDGVTVTRNDYEACTLRLVKGTAGGGRSLLDLTIRRGSRFVEGYLQTSTATTLSVWARTATPMTSGTGVAFETSTFSDTFESGALASWPTVTGSVSASASSAYQGTYGLRLAPAGTAATVATSTTKWTQNTYRYGLLTARFRVNSFTAGQSVDLFTVQNTGALNNADFFVNTSGVFVLDLTGATTFVNTGVAPVLGRWYELQLLVDYGTTTYRARLFLDGVDYGWIEDPGEVASHVRSLHIGTGSAKTFQVDVDTVSFTVSTTEPLLGKAVVGSARTHTVLTAQGGLYRTSSTALDFFLGRTPSGSASAPGDRYDVLRDQYLTAMAVTDRGAKR